MREIKFRAWDDEKKAWKGMWIFRGGHATERSHYEEPEIFDLSKYFSNPGVILMQYTGLKDKNGNEIWEGDILDAESRRWIVFWDIYRWMIKAADGNSYYTTIIRSKSEVIGNIYENPELLERQP